MAWRNDFNLAGQAEGKERSILGYANESLAIGRALQCGYNLFFKAWRDSAYDAVLDYDGVLFRIEIKGSHSRNLSVTSGGRSGKLINKKVASREHVLRTEDADFLIGVNGFDGSCYIVPVEVVQILNQKSIALSRLNIYKEKWSIFTGIENFPTKTICSGFSDKSITELNEICRRHQIGLIDNIPRRRVELSEKERLVLSVWSYIYEHVE